jgi:2-haloacid dehalogenase
VRTLADFDALSFDCYGTLIDWETGILAVLSPWADARGLTETDDRLLELFAAAESKAEADHPTMRYPDILRLVMVELGAKLGVDSGEAHAERLATSVPDWPAFADAHDALTMLASKYRLIVLSNVDRASFEGSRLRLGVPFAAVVTAEDVGSYKPAAANFDVLLATVAELGIAPERLLHVAQSLFHDHVPAQTAGLATVWIDRRRGRQGWGATPPPPTDVRPDWVFESMAEFAAEAAR